MRSPELLARLESKRFILRDFTPSDRAAFVAYQMDERYRALYGTADNDSTRASSNALFDRFLAWQEEQPRRNFQVGIFDKSSGDLLGCVGLRGKDLPVDSAIFGIELSPTHWGRHRAAIEASTMMIAFGFRELDLASIMGVTASDNKRIARLADWFGAEVVAERHGSENSPEFTTEWTTECGTAKVDWSLKRNLWEHGTPDASRRTDNFAYANCNHKTGTAAEMQKQACEGM
ncbi:MAG: GNAT family N-acetyltransferase [Thalassospira sp.]|nr:GNAT family N-acetyltransferase [Thalassospira sp.]